MVYHDVLLGLACKPTSYVANRVGEQGLQQHSAAAAVRVGIVLLLLQLPQLLPVSCCPSLPMACSCVCVCAAGMWFSLPTNLRC
jgi:hypothetical protein